MWFCWVPFDSNFETEWKHCKMIQWNVFLIKLFNVNMIVRIIGLVFLFIIRIRFPRGKSIADIIRNRYGEAFVKKNTKVWKVQFQIVEMHLDLRFSLDCKKNGVFSKFLRFKLANRHLNNSHVYRKCQNQSKRGLILWKMIHRGLRKNYKEHFLY